MKSSTMNFVVFAALLVSMRAAAQDQPHYTVQNLGSLGGTNGSGGAPNKKGWVVGTSNLAGDQRHHPFLWRDGEMEDLGTLGGPNANIGGLNDVGEVTVGGADTGTADPLGEDWCGFGTYQVCRSFVWRSGKRTLVPTLGGNNGDVAGITNTGLVIGFAETTVHDTTCIAPQVLGFKAFVWNPDRNEMRILPPLPGDTASVAFDMNEQGDVAGSSGICGGGLVGTSALHAVVWKNALPTDLGSFGGTYNNYASSINNIGQVIGTSDLVGDTTSHAFLWTDNEGIQDLGTLPGDFSSVGSGINDHGQAVGQSCDATGNYCRAVIWDHGVIMDLNTLIPPSSPLFLVFASGINSRGQIGGAALDQSTGATAPFIATPCDEEHAADQGCADNAGGSNATGATSKRPSGILIRWESLGN